MRYITTVGALWVGWCLDSLCGGSIMGSVVCHLPLCSRSQYQWGIHLLDNSSCVIDGITLPTITVFYLRFPFSLLATVRDC